MKKEPENFTELIPTAPSDFQIIPASYPTLSMHVVCPTNTSRNAFLKILFAIYPQMASQSVRCSWTPLFCCAANGGLCHINHFLFHHFCLSFPFPFYRLHAILCFLNQKISPFPASSSSSALPPTGRRTFNQGRLHYQRLPR